MWKRFGMWLLNGFLFFVFVACAVWVGTRFQQGAIIVTTIVSVATLLVISFSSKRMLDGENVMRTSLLIAVLFNAVMWGAYYIHTGWMWQFIKTHVLR